MPIPEFLAIPVCQTPQVEASVLRSNFLRFAEKSSKSDEMVLTQGGFTALMHVLGVTDTRMLQRIFEAWDTDCDGEFEFKEFLQAVALVLKGGSSEKIETLFHIIDLNGDGVFRSSNTADYAVLPRC